MDILISILWFLQVFFTDVTYTQAEVDQMIIDHDPEITVIQEDEVLTDQIYTDYINEVGETTNIIETAEEPDPEPILE